VQAKLVRGVSTRDYRDVIGQIVEGTALPKSTVSRAFVRASRMSLEQINGRDLSKELFVALFIDGIGFGETLVVAAMGVSMEGHKVFLGLQEGHTENATVVSALLDNLVDRGLTLTDHFLAVVDGAKALKSALLKRWQGRVVIQRCQVHKKRNVLDHLPPPYHAEVKRRMSVAYAMTDEVEARKVLLNLIEWLRQSNGSAAESLKEGMDETLTVVRLGLPEPLRRTFSTTNPLESAFDGVSSRTGRVKRWRNGRGQMVLRWAAAAGLQVESRLHRIRGHQLINLMVKALDDIHVDVRKEVG
jgi:transposase-like protein